MFAKYQKVLKIAYYVILGISAFLFINAVLDIRNNPAVSAFTKGSLFWGVCLIGIYMFLSHYANAKREEMEDMKRRNHDLQK